MNQLSQLRKELELANDQGLTIGLSVPVPVAHVIASTSIPGVGALVVVTASEMVLVPTTKIG